jgi:hypothetical protein
MKGFWRLRVTASLRGIGTLLRFRGFLAARLTTRFFTCWKRGLVLYIRKPIYEFERIFNKEGERG